MLRNRKVIIAIVMVVLLATAGLAAAAMTPSAADLLTAALTNVENATDGHAVIEFDVTTPEMSGAGSVEVWGQLNAGPNGEPAFRLEVLSSTLTDAPIGLTAVGDGTTFWVWHPVENVVLTDSYEAAAAAMMAKMSEAEGEFDHEGGDMPALPEEADIPQTPEEAVAKLLEYVTAERDGTAEIGGDTAYQIRLLPIPEQMPEEMRALGGLVNVWVRTGDRVPLGAEFTGSAVGSARVTAVSLQLNEGVEPGAFTFTIPADAEVLTLADLETMHAEETAVEAEPAFTVLSPTELPDGAVLVDTLNVRGAVVQQYTTPDGRDFTVAQAAGDIESSLLPAAEGETISVRGVDGLIFQDEDGARTLVTWAENGVSVLVGGDLTSAEALAIAESLR